MSFATTLGILLLLLVAGGIFYTIFTLRRKGEFTIGVRAFVLIISGLMAITSLWLVVGANINPARIGWIFFGINLLSFVYTALEPQIAEVFRQRIAPSQAMMTGRSIVIGNLGGIVFGVGLIVMSGLTGFTIAVPEVSFSVAGDGVLQFLTTTIIAPFSEEPFFLVVVPSFLTLVFLAFLGQSQKLPAMGASLVVSSVIFSMFHWYAYGANLSLAIGAFTGAFLFRLFMLITELVKEHEFTVTAGSKTLSIAIPTHVVFNTYVYTRPLFIAGNGGAG